MEETNLRKILRNEITWVVFLIGAILSFVKGVIIPINNIQLSVTEMQKSIVEIQRYDERITQNSNDIIRIQTIMGIKKN